MFPIFFVDNFAFRLENGTRLLASVRIRNWRSSRDDFFSWPYQKSSTKNIIQKDTTQISTFKRSWSEDANPPRPSNRIRSNEKMINRICSPTSRQYDWKYNLCCSVSSSSSYVLHFFSSDKLISYTLFGFRLPFTFNFLLTLRSLSVHRTLIFLRSKSWIDSMMFHPLKMKFDIRFLESSVSTLYLQFLTVQFRWYFKFYYLSRMFSSNDLISFPF